MPGYKKSLVETTMAKSLTFEVVLSDFHIFIRLQIYVPVQFKIKCGNSTLPTLLQHGDIITAPS